MRTAGEADILTPPAIVVSARWESADNMCAASPVWPAVKYLAMICWALFFINRPLLADGRLTTSHPDREMEVIRDLVDHFNKATEKQTKSKYEALLQQHKGDLEAVFLVASQLPADKNHVLLPLLESCGEAAVALFVDGLGRDPGSSEDVAVKVTAQLGVRAVPGLIDQYRHSAAIRVRQYIAGSVKEILRRLPSPAEIAGATNIIEWASEVASEKDETLVVYSLKLLGVMFNEKNEKDIEPTLKAKLTDSRRAARIAAIDVLSQVRSDAPYVIEYVLAGARGGKDRMERSADIAVCSRLPVTETLLDVLYECAFDKDKVVQSATEQALRTLGPKAAPLAERMLKKLIEGNTDSLGAILAVIKYEEKERATAETALVKILKTSDPQGRQRSVDFLASMPSLRDETVLQMTTLLDDPDKAVRTIAIRAIYAYRGKDYVREAVKKRIDREAEPSVRKLLELFLQAKDQ